MNLSPHQWVSVIGTQTVDPKPTVRNIERIKQSGDPLITFIVKAVEESSTKDELLERIDDGREQLHRASTAIERLRI